MNDGVGNLRIVGHQSILDDVRQRVGVRQMHIGRQPDVEVEKYIVARSARADLMASEHAGDGQYHRLDV